MKTAIKVVAIVGIVLGGLAILGGLASDDPSNAVVGGLMFIGWGTLDLVFLNSLNK